MATTEVTRLTPELVAAYRHEGQWRGRPLHAALLTAAARRPRALSGCRSTARPAKCATA